MCMYNITSVVVGVNVLSVSGAETRSFSAAGAGVVAKTGGASWSFSVVGAGAPVVLVGVVAVYIEGIDSVLKGKERELEKNTNLQ